MGCTVGTVYWTPTQSDELFKEKLGALASTYNLTTTNSNYLDWRENKTYCGGSIEGLRLLFWNNKEAIKYVEKYVNHAKIILEQNGATDIDINVKYLPA
uniref:Uncharacterized protein n=1 Tax=Marseillevirus LCMAC102 TaxID=2506603 RepID=A0A481YSX6_9VIRU|nr:MAG: hypothetical protein LCMAC102_01230 [Marseillevirus LCMAC102]